MVTEAKEACMWKWIRNNIVGLVGILQSAWPWVLVGLSAAITFLAPYLAYIQKASTYIVLIVFALLACLSIWIYIGALNIKDRKRRTPLLSSDSTFIDLEYFDDPRQPSARTATNIKRWYVLLNRIISPSDKGGMVVTDISSNLFIIFENKIRYSEIIVSSEDFTVPSHEIKDKSDEHLVAVFSGKMPRGVLKIRFKAPY